MITSVAHARGFADPVADAQRVFRAVLEALSRPTLPQEVSSRVVPPAPLSPMIGALVLTLCDEQTPIWLDATLRDADDVGSWVRFHTGASIVDDPSDAMFCVVTRASSLPPFDALRQGTDEEPHLSSTVIIDAAGASAAGPFVATGPGVREDVVWDGAGLPASRPERSAFLAAWAENSSSHPRGVDLILAGNDVVRGLPRTTSLTLASHHEDAAKKVRTCM